MGIKKAVKQRASAFKKQIGPHVKQALKAALQAAKNEAKKSGKQLLKDAARSAATAAMYGMGDYRTNSLIRGGMNGTPSFGPASSTFIRREPLGKVISSSVAGEFKMEKFTVNPGLASTFPWLSGLANNYESWKPISMIFEYVPTSGMSVASGNTALGTVVLAPQYNPLASDPQNLQQIQGIQQACTFAPYEKGAVGIECKTQFRQADTLLIRNANLGFSLVGGSGSDTLFDLCEFFVATEGLQEPSVVVGQIFVTYKIQMNNPIVPISFPWNTGIFINGSAGTPPGSNMFAVPANSVIQDQNRSDPKSVVLGINNSIRVLDLDPGRYLLFIKLSFTGLTTQGALSGKFVDDANVDQGTIAQEGPIPQNGLVNMNQAGYFCVWNFSGGLSKNIKISVFNVPATTLSGWSWSLIRVSSNLSLPIFG